MLLLVVGFLNIFIIGPPGIGKTTVVKRVMEVLEKEAFRAGGIYCPEIRGGDGRRIGFEVINVLTGDRGILSHILQPSGPRVGKYKVNLKDLSRIGVHAIETAMEEADYIVIDEVGPMELKGRAFQLAVLKALESSKPVIGILHWKMRHPIINLIKAQRNVKIYELTRKNRDKMHEILINEIYKTLKPKGRSS